MVACQGHRRLPLAQFQTSNIPYFDTKAAIPVGNRPIVAADGKKMCTCTDEAAIIADETHPDDHGNIRTKSCDGQKVVTDKRR
jgi:hypothetical protein